MTPALDPVLHALAGRREAFVAFAARRARDRAEAEDLVQQSFARAATHVGGLRDPARAVAWFYRILRRQIAEQHAARAQAERRLESLPEVLDPTAPEESASCACVLGLLDRLSPADRDLLRRIDLEDVALAETARALGITANAAGVRLHRARARLREELTRACGVPRRTPRAGCADCDCAA